MTQIRKFSYMMLAALSALLAIGAGLASASLTATVTPNPSAVTGTAGALQYSFNTARRTVDCTTSSVRATLGSAAGASPLAISTNLAWGLSGCTQTGGLRFFWTCSANQNLSVTGATAAGVTTATAGIDCVESISATCSVHITGRMSVTYNNLTSQLTLISPSGQSIFATGSTCSTLPNDVSVTMGSSTGGNLVFTVSPLTTVSVV